MIDKLEETFHDDEPEAKHQNWTHLILNRFNTYIVSNFSDLNKASIYKLPYRYIPYHEIEKLMSFKYLHLSKPNERTEDFYIRKSNDMSFLFEIEDKKYVYVEGKLVTFETNDKKSKLFFRSQYLS